MRDIELKSSRITIDHTPWFGNKKLRSYIEKIRTSINENKYISFKYFDRLGIKSQRKIEPYRLVLKDSNWYVQ
jgi:predicted DNA-binding transcriptional regulator YafY